MPNNTPDGLPNLANIPPETLSNLIKLYGGTYGGGGAGGAPFWAPPGSNASPGQNGEIVGSNPNGTGLPQPGAPTQPFNSGGMYQTPAVPDNWQSLPPEQQKAIYEQYQMSTTWQALPGEWRSEISGWPQSYRDAFLQTYQLHATGVLYDGQFMSGDEAAAKIRDAARGYLQSQANSNAGQQNNQKNNQQQALNRLPNQAGLPFIQPSPYL